MEKIEWKIPKKSNDPDDSIELSLNNGDQIIHSRPEWIRQISFDASLGFKSQD